MLLIYLNDMQQAVKPTLFLYADDSRILYQQKEVDEIENQLKKDFENICDWFVGKKLRIHFGKKRLNRFFFQGSVEQRMSFN